MEKRPTGLRLDPETYERLINVISRDVHVRYYSIGEFAVSDVSKGAGDVQDHGLQSACWRAQDQSRRQQHWFIRALMLFILFLICLIH